MDDTTTPLRTGWEPDTAPDDTIARQALLAHVARAVGVARAQGRPVLEGDGFVATDLGIPGLFGNQAFLLDPARVDEALEHLDEVFAPGQGFLLGSPFPLPDLRSRRFEPVGHPPLMYLPRADRTRTLPQGLHIEEVRDAAALQTHVETLAGAFPLPEWSGLPAAAVFSPALLDDGATRFWIGSTADGPVCTSVTTIHAGVNLVEFVSTHPSARGHGFGEAITWAAATADPELPAVLLASDDGRPVYQRMGFLTVERWTLWVRPGRA